MGYIRILLALVVATGHLQSAIYDAPISTIISVGPVVAVKLFFVISGFYMAMVYDRYSSTSAFFLSRAIRLYPIYWTTILLTLSVGWILQTPSIAPFINLTFSLNVDQPMPLILYWFSNLSFVGLDLGIFLCEQFSDRSVYLSVAHNAACVRSGLVINTTIVQPAWTLSLELYFYLLVPIFALGGKRRVAWVALISFVLAIGIAFFNNKNPWFRSFFPAELYLFLAGYLAFQLKERIPVSVGRGCALVSLVCILGYQHIPAFDWSDPSRFNIALYLAFAGGLPSLFTLCDKLPFERLVGELSYPVYISHALTESLVYTLKLHIQLSLSLYQWIAFNIATVIAVAAILFMAMLPIEKVRDFIKSRSKTRMNCLQDKLPVPPRGGTLSDNAELVEG